MIGFLRYGWPFVVIDGAICAVLLFMNAPDWLVAAAGVVLALASAPWMAYRSRD